MEKNKGFVINNFFIIIRLFNILKIPSKKFSILNISKNKELDLINSIKKNLLNLNYINRSFAQYKCHISFYRKTNIVIFNVSSFLLFIPILVFLIANRFIILFSNKLELFIEKTKLSKSENIAVFFGINKNKIPNSLKKGYYFIKIIPNFALDFKTLFFLITKLYIKFYYYPYFCLKNTIKISLYNANIILERPKAFIVTSEYSFTSSILTYYCEINNCEHINIMHGEKLFFIKDSFFKFHKCYVWHEHYANLFKKLGADENQFIIELPQTINKKNIISTKYRYYDKVKILKYYLGDETDDQLYKLSKFLDKLSKEIKISIIIRPHPFHPLGDIKIEKLNRIFNKFKIEFPNDISITESIILADFVAALYSTVLFEGYCLGKKIVVNDLDKNIYEKLKELDFIVFELQHIRLSQILTQVT